MMERNYGAFRGLSRFEGFTDAVFAIALTLLMSCRSPPRAIGQEPKLEEQEEA